MYCECVEPLWCAGEDTRGFIINVCEHCGLAMDPDEEDARFSDAMAEQADAAYKASRS